jgi:N-acetylneuraminic acid mutarotase
MPTPRDHAAGAVVDGRLYVAAGRPHDLTVAESYDPATDRWTTLSPLPLGRSSLAGAALGGRFVVLGGEHPGERHVDAEVDAYDPATRRWSRLPDLPAGRQGIGAAVVHDRLYLPGGGPSGGGSRQSNTLLVLAAG